MIEGVANFVNISQCSTRIKKVEADKQTSTHAGRGMSSIGFLLLGRDRVPQFMSESETVVDGGGDGRGIDCIGTSSHSSTSEMERSGVRI